MRSQFEKDMAHRLRTIRRRCNSPKASRYNRYGGRGIKCFLTLHELISVWRRDNGDSLKQPSVDRIDNDGHYEVGNIRYIELGENTRLSNLARKSVTHCRSGHPFDERNTYWLRGRRYCRDCNNIRNRTGWIPARKRAGGVGR